MDYKNYILCGLIAFGMIVTAISKPTPNESTATNEDALQNDQNDDYDYEQPAEQAKSTASSPKSTMLPSFDTTTLRRNVKPGGNITLECPAKNLTESNVILWFKEDNTITNDQNVLNNAYQLSKQNFSLIIKNATESFAGEYFCEVAPQKIRMKTILTVSNETIPAVPTSPDVPQAKEAAATTESPGSAAPKTHIESSLLTLVLVSSLMSHRKCFQTLFTF